MISLNTDITNIDRTINMTTDEKINAIYQKTKDNTNLQYINKLDVIEWLFKKIHNTKIEEDKWGATIINDNTKQYTTKLGENIVKDILILLNLNPIKEKKKTTDEQNIDPDWIANDGVYECKARTWNTSGTAGEKILGTPYKYAEVSKLYNKPLYIVCIAYQEYEALNMFKIFDNSKSIEKNKLLEFLEETLGIKYIKCTDLLLKILD